MANLTSGLEGVAAYLDDVIVMGVVKQSMSRIWKQFSGALSTLAFKSDQKKCNFVQTRVKYPGYVLDEDGRKSGPAKFVAIQRREFPKSCDHSDRFWAW